MTFRQLAIRNLVRNKLRTGLTVLGVATAVTIFLLLRVMMWAWTAGSRTAPMDRIVTRHRIALALPLPRHYVDDVRALPHVRATTWMTGFGGKDPKHDAVLFGSAAIDAATFFDVYDEITLPPDQLERFRRDRQGAIVGEAIAAKLGWKVGDRIVLESGFFPADWQFTIDGIYRPSTRSANDSNFLLRWDYLNDVLPPTRNFRDEVGLIVSRVDDPARSADVSVAIDRVFEAGETPTLSQDERSAAASVLAMYSAVLDAMNVVSGVILIVLTLILANTIAMDARERTVEYGVLRAIGFLPHHIARWVVGESCVTGVLGGVLGACLAWPVIDCVVRDVIERNVGSFFPYFHLDARQAAIGVGLAGGLGGVAAAIPAWRASKLRVIDSLRRVA